MPQTEQVVEVGARQRLAYRRRHLEDQLVLTIDNATRACRPPALSRRTRPFHPRRHGCPWKWS